MFKAIRKQITPATVLAFVALVFAITGGAFAATGGNGSGGGGSSPGKASASTGRVASFTATAAKKSKKKAAPTSQPGPRGPAGPAGAAGPAGPAGSAGAKGENGTAGTNGTNGTDGTNGTPGAPGATGSEGSFDKTLPSEKTLEGEWSMLEYVAGSGFEGLVTTSVSFGIPLGQTPVPHLIRIGGGEAVVNEKNEEEVVPSAQCKGSAADPTASPGSLCIYTSGELNAVKFNGLILPRVCAYGAEAAIQCASSKEDAVDRFGFSLLTFAEKAGLVDVTGSWAVTA